MSWSISAVGKTAAVAAKVAEDLAKIHCAEPEETIKGKVGEIVAAVLEKFPAGVAVKVIASGSQYTPSDKTPDAVINSVSLAIEPIYGFVE